MMEGKTQREGERPSAAAVYRLCEAAGYPPLLSLSISPFSALSIAEIFLFPSPIPIRQRCERSLLEQLV